MAIREQSEANPLSGRGLMTYTKSVSIASMPRHDNFPTIQMLWRSYGLFGALGLASELITTRLLFPGARLIRRPAHIRGRRWIDFGSRLTTGRGLRIDALGDESTRVKLICFGTDVSINDYVHIGAVQSVVIGDRVLMGSKVLITDHNHGSYGTQGKHSDPRIPPSARPLVAAPVVIEDDVWIGEFVSVLPGVRIGKGSIIGTLSTVARDIPPYCVAAGNPARVLKRYDLSSGQWNRE
jgi:acetyltransferase-like isoleucine patch superfamily enzyme